MSSLYCSQRLYQSKVFSELGKLVGSNDVLQMSMVLQSFVGDNFLNDFVEFYKQTHKGKEPNIDVKNAQTAKSIAKSMFQYYYIKHPSVDSFIDDTKSNDYVREKGYTSVFEREEGKKHCATFLLDIFNELQNNNRKLEGNKYKQYLARLKRSWAKLMFQAIHELHPDMDIKTIQDAWARAEDKAGFIDSLLGGKDKSISNANRFAVYQELFASDTTAINFMNEVFADTRLQYVLSEVRKDLEAENSRKINDGNKDNEKKDSDDVVVEDDVEDFNNSISVYNNHIGAYTTFMTHVSARIKNYFNSLRKLNSPKIGDVDTSNTYGIADTMDANACSTMLYSRGKFTNVTTMIESIEEIGRTVAGFESFVQFAQDLRNNLDFAHEVFSVYALIKMSKVETRIENNKAVVVISNPRIDPSSAMNFDMMNDAKTSISNNHDTLNEQTITLAERVKNTLELVRKSKDSKTSESARTNFSNIANNNIVQIKQDIVTLLKGYFPSLQEKAILAYIELNDNAGSNTETQLRNINSLIDDVKLAIQKANDSYRLKQQVDINISKANKHNSELRSGRRGGNIVESAEFIDVRQYYNDDYIDPMKSPIKSIASKLLKYSVIDTSLNSRNIYGNNVSDIIKTSHLTQLSDMLSESYQEEVFNEKGERIGYVTRNKRLEAWGLKKLRSKQYKYSNLLLEQPGVGNKAIFRYVNGQLCLTEDAPEILKVYLFNGSANRDEGTNILYEEMVSGDYAPTSFINFFRTVDKNIGNFKLATYFLRTPSDAPRNFAIRSVRYSTDGLFIIKDKEKFANDINEIIDSSVPTFDIFEYQEKYRTKAETPYSEFKNEDVTQLLFPEKGIMIWNNQSIKKISTNENGTDHAYVSFVTKDHNLVVLEGDVEKAGKGKKLSNAKLVGVLDRNLDDEISKTGFPENLRPILTNYFSDKLKKGDVTVGEQTWTKPEKAINRSHPVFQMIKNQFKQELLDGGVALNHYFEFTELEDGTFCMRIENGQPVMREDRDNNTGYINYHLDKKGRVLHKTSDGYQLNGNVFHSNKFTVTVTDKKGNKKNINFLNRIIKNDTNNLDDNTINFFYGEALRFQCSTNENGELVVEDIVLSDNIEEIIDNNLEEFLHAYNADIAELITSKEQFIHDVEVNDDTITEYAMNNFLMHMTYDEILEGSVKFYKSAQDVLKRSRENQGSGSPYGISNYSDNFADDLSNIDDAFLNSADIQKKFEGTMFEGITQRRGFRAITVRNTIMTNNEALDQLVEKLVENGLSREKAVDKLYGSVVLDENGKPVIDNKTGEPIRRGGFSDTKVNDAQSYITIQEWVRRVAAKGQLGRYMPLIEKLIQCEKDPNVKLSAKELDDFIQVQKNFYYDLYYDERYGIEVPRQIKNAEFVLIPQLIAGTQLESVYDMMRAADIDQLNTLETSKASNETVLTLWDNNGNIVWDKNGQVDGTIFSDFIDVANGSAQIYSYNNLYTQQETPQHMNTENKAAIQFVKKIFDNVDENTHLGDLKKEFFKLFSTNIQESFNKLLDEFEIERDENGAIKTDSEGRLANLNLKVFLNRLKDELMRTGLDSNLVDYVTVPENSSLPLMPSYMNNILTKFESVVQSVFNHAITRQTLPGFHSPQVTNVGFRALGDTIPDVSYSKDLKYHPNGEPYIEVMLPYSFLGIDKNSSHYRNMTDEQILQELRYGRVLKEGEEYTQEELDNAPNLDYIIGYRIPTEGKQSICNMKVVGFVSDGYGSTIVVPNDWVAQTGSDFDVDSVYGFQFETYKTLSGQVKKINYKKEVTKYDWFAYIMRNIADKNLDPNVKEKIKRAKAEVDAELSRELKNLEAEENELYRQLDDESQKRFRIIQAAITKENKQLGLTGKDAYLRRIERLNEILSDTVNNDSLGNSTEFIEQIKKILSKYNEIYDFLNNQSDEYNERSKERIESVLQERLDKFNDAAKTSNLMTLDEFINPANIDKANGKKARNSRILEIMQEVLGHPSSLEENLSRSNFEHAVESRNKMMSDDVSTERNNRSPYSVGDQIRYQEEAMSGAKLKALSVNLDTFCSVCNTVRPMLGSDIYIVYDSDQFENPQEVMDRFDAGKHKVGAKQFAIHHKHYGWSNDNRNVTGDILTAYSSETTALALDAIKEGSTPNVNDYTFNVYKTFLNIGSSYDAASAFIMQPGVTAIVDAYNSKNSVFSKGKGNVVHQAIRAIASDLDVNTDDNVNITTLLASINKRYGKKFNKLFGTNDVTISLDFEDIKEIPIIISKLEDRNKNRGDFKSNSPVGKERKALWDLGIALIFNRLSNIANEIDNVNRCMNPDKFGAKQSIFATREVFDNIDKCLFEREEKPAIGRQQGDKVVKSAKKPILEVNGKHILEAVYPGVSNPEFSIDDMVDHINQNNDTNNSAYPSLYAFLKYATVTSTIIAKTVFETQNSHFVNLINSFRSVLSGYNPRLSEDTYNDLQKYVLSSMYNNVTTIKYAVHVKQEGDRLILEKTELKEGDNEYLLAQNETKRIYGYEHSSIVGEVVTKEVISTSGNKLKKNVIEEFEVNDINNITEEEILKFEKLSPAQKVKWIKANFSNPGIFGMLHETLYNSNARGRYVGMQTIEFNEDQLNNNVVFAEFQKAITSKHPLIVSAAIDLVKYSVQVEGMRMSARSINKIIDNDCLIESLEDGGLGFVDELRGMIADLNSSKGHYALTENIEKLYENYLRSHPETPGIETIYITDKNKAKYGLYKKDYGIYYLAKKDDKSSDEANQKSFDSLMESAGIKYYLPLSEYYKTNKYIRIIEGNNNTLYKIVDNGSFIILHPLSKLELNENSEWSANEANNVKFLSPTAYSILVNDYIQSDQKEKLAHAWIQKKIDEYKKEGKRKELWYEARKNNNRKVPALEFNIHEEIKEGKLISLYSTIRSHYVDPTVNDILFVKDLTLDKYIFTPGIEFGTTQRVDLPSNTRNAINVNISIPLNLAQYSKYLKPTRNGTWLDVSSINSPSLRKIVKNQQDLCKQTGNTKNVYLNDVYQITPVDDEAYAATAEEATSATIDYAEARKAAENESLSANYVFGLVKHGIDSHEDSIASKKVVATRETAKYATQLAKKISDDFNHFLPDPDNADVYLSMTDDKVLAHIREDELAFNNYIKAINAARGFVSQFQLWNDVSVESEDTDIRDNINEIKKAVEKVSKLPITEVNRRANEVYADKISTNPLIKERLIDVFDGFYRTYGYMWQYHDLMENGTPILQIVLKDVMGNIEADRSHFLRHTREEFWKKVKEIQAEAARKGEPIRWDVLVDADGRFVQDWDGTFVEELNRLREERDAAAVPDPNDPDSGLGSIKHLRAKLAYDKFKATHCNQEAATEYYEKKVEYEEYMINNYPELYSKYMKLFYERAELFEYQGEDGLDEHEQKRLAEINQEMFNLHRPNFYVQNGEIIQRTSGDKIYGRKAAQMLDAYINSMRGLNNKYFKYDPVYNFDSQLKKYLKIVQTFERRINGIPTVPQTILDQIPQYVEARRWIDNNARFELSTETDTSGEPIGLGARLKKAFKILSMSSNGRSFAINKIMKDHNNGEGIADSEGIADARKLSDEEIANIKARQEESYNIRGLAPFTDRVLISNARPDSARFTPEFYAGMRKSSSRTANTEYLKVVTELNKLLEPYYDAASGIVCLDRIPDTPEGIALLKEIGKKYDELRKYKKLDNEEKDADVAKFIKDNVEFEVNKPVWYAHVTSAMSKSAEYQAAWNNVAFEKTASGKFVVRKGKNVPNRFLYSYARPKGKPGEEKYDKFVDKSERAEALNLVQSVYRKVPTRYYYEAMTAAMDRAQNDPNYDYNEWYIQNHIYNPYTRKMEPLECWMRNSVKDEYLQDGTFQGKWVPRSRQRERSVKDGNIDLLGEQIYDAREDMRNSEYNPDKGLVGNYRKGGENGKYDTKVVLNDSEKAMRKYLQDTLEATARVDSARRYFKSGWLPRSMKSETTLRSGVKEIGKMFGIGVASNNGKDPFYDKIGYEYDRTPLMPMTDLLNNKQTIDISEKLKEIKDKEITREQYNSDAEYEKAVEDRETLIKEYEEQLRKERQSLLNRDWLNVIDSYLEQASRYNSILENKQKLYFLLNTLKDMKMYSRKYGMYGDLKVDNRKSSAGDIYEKSIDENLIKQYENWLRRLLFDQWKEAEGFMTKVMNNLQGFTSANYMMLNVRGGIANVTLGETGILAEAAAREYFGVKDWGFGTAEWIKGSIGFARGGLMDMFNNSGYAYNKQDAIIKFFNVVDYDEIAGVRRDMSLEEYTKKIRDFMFSPQTVGEHFMQNSVLFAMLKSHKIVTDEKGNSVFMSKREYVDHRLSQLLPEVLSEEQLKNYNEWKDELKKDKNKVKEYAWFRRNALSDYIYLHCSKEQIKEFIKIRKQHEEEIKKEFDEKQDIYSQLDISNGKMQILEGSELAQLDTILANSKDNFTQADLLLGRMAEKVRKVNNKIHGVYNRQGSAYIERKSFGSLIMQYHKHLPMGLLKRYMARGHWNETRGSVDKGMIQSVADVLRLNWEKIKADNNMSDKQLGALQGLTFILAHSLDYLAQLKTTWAIAPAYDRANIMRNLGDLVGVVGGVAMMAAIWAMMDDDDDSIFANLMLYEADRLQSEAFLYNPWGAFIESKKLLSTPVAAQSVISDAMSTAGAILEWMFDDEYDPYYHSGRFAGEHKVSVYIQRRIPMWNGIRGILDTPSNNHYYKLGTNVGGVIKFNKD